jgi:YVTN family beta-propeller protein
MTPGALAVDVLTGRVFVTNVDSGSVSMLDARSGIVMRTVAVSAFPAAVTVDEHANRAFVVAWGPADSSGRPIGPGGVSVLDARSGTLLRTISVGMRPRAVAVDEQIGRAFVVNERVRRPCMAGGSGYRGGCDAGSRFSHRCRASIRSPAV